MFSNIDTVIKYPFMVKSYLMFFKNRLKSNLNLGSKEISKSNKRKNIGFPIEIFKVKNKYIDGIIIKLNCNYSMENYTLKARWSKFNLVNFGSRALFKFSYYFILYF